MSDERREEERPKPGARYPIYVGVAFLALIVYVTINTIQTDEGGLLGADPKEEGRPLPEFAVPDLRGELVGDANVFQDDCETGDNPCPEDAVREPACRIETEGAIRVCDLFDKPLAISFWFTKGGDCLPTQDVFDDVAARYGGRVNFLSLNVRSENRDEPLGIVEERGWEVPVGWDRDGAVSNIYRVGVCPTVALAYPGGILDRALIGSEELTEPKLEAAIDDLIADSETRSRVR
jgi:hypothetical protein